MKATIYFFFIGTLLLLFAPSSVFAQELVADINRANASSFPRHLLSNDRWTVFVADTDSHQSRLFYVKAPEDTARVFPAFIPASSQLGRNGMKLIGDTLHLGLYHEGSFIWYVADLNAGSITELARISGGGPNTTIDDLIPLAEKLTLLITNDFGITSLYTSEGSPANTRKLGDLELRRGAGNLITTDSLIFFLDGADTGGSSLWQSDGTLAGTIPVQLPDALGTDFTISELTPYRNFVYFVAVRDGSAVVYIYDSTSTETGRFREFRPGGEAASLPRNMQVNNDTLYCYTVQNSGKWRIWKSDGTESGTQIVLERSATDSLSRIGNLIAAPSKIYFRRSVAGTPSTLWRTNGTAQGTYELAALDEDPTRVTINGRPLFNTPAGGLYFLAHNNATGLEIWYTDGDERPTAPVADIFPGPQGSIPGAFRFADFTRFSGFSRQGNKAIFVADNGIVGNEIFTTDGTEAGTKLMVDPLTQNQGSSPNSFIPFGEQLLFLATTRHTGLELFSTRPEANSTMLVKDIRPGFESSDIESPTAFQEHIYYIDDDRIWRTDGTEDGTEILPFAVDSTPINVRDIAILGDNMLVHGFIPGLDLGLFLTSGDPEDVIQIQTFNIGIINLRETIFTNLNDSVVLFPEFYPPFGAGLWRTDGTEAGTFVINELDRRDIAINGIPNILVNEEQVYFSKKIGEMPGAPFVSDGTAEGTRELVPRGSFHHGISHVTQFISYGNLIYFDGRFNSTPAGLFSINLDGEVKRVVRRGGQFDFTAIDNLRVVNGKFFFSIETEEEGNELWVIDFPGEKAHLVKDLNAGSFSASPRDLTIIDSCLYFSAETITEGRELFRTDGTAEGTVLVADINPGTASANVQHLYAFRGSLYFSADDGVLGAELWRYTPGPEDDSCNLGRVVNTNADNSPEFNFTPYPNPASEIVHLDLPIGNHRITLVSSDGKQVKEIAFRSSNPDLLVGDLPRGLYILHIFNQQSGETSVRSLVLH